jgi:hypothetical protein
MVCAAGGHITPAKLDVDRMDAMCVDDGEVFHYFSRSSARFSTMTEAELDTERPQRYIIKVRPCPSLASCRSYQLLEHH